jgi:hypothetical protein
LLQAVNRDCSRRYAARREKTHASSATRSTGGKLSWRGAYCHDPVSTDDPLRHSVELATPPDVSLRHGTRGDSLWFAATMCKKGEPDGSP